MKFTKGTFQQKLGSLILMTICTIKVRIYIDKNSFVQETMLRTSRGFTEIRSLKMIKIQSFWPYNNFVETLTHHELRKLIFVWFYILLF